MTNEPIPDRQDADALDDMATRVPEPPEPFDPEEFILAAGKPLYRVFSNTRTVTEFNPSGAPASQRFSFFGDPQVPVLYAAATDEAAVCETLLHNIPEAGGYLPPAGFRNKVMALARPNRDLRLARFMGTGLRKLKVETRQLTDTPSSQYEHTNRWAEAAHAAGFDGIVWMARKCNTDEAYVLFGDRVHATDLASDPSFARIFLRGQGFDWLVDFCTPLHVEVLTDL